MRISDHSTFEDFHKAREEEFYKNNPDHDSLAADNGRSAKRQRLLVDKMNYYGDKAIAAEKKAEQERLEAEAQAEADRVKAEIMAKYRPEETELNKALTSLAKGLLG